MKLKEFSATIKLNNIEYDAQYKGGTLTLKGISCVEAEDLLNMIEEMDTPYAGVEPTNYSETRATSPVKFTKPTVSKYAQIKQEIWDNAPLSKAKASLLRAKVRTMQYGIDALVQSDADELLAQIDAEEELLSSRSLTPRTEVAVSVTTKQSIYEELEVQVTEKDAVDKVEYAELSDVILGEFAACNITTEEKTSLMRALNHRYPQALPAAPMLSGYGTGFLFDDSKYAVPEVAPKYVEVESQAKVCPACDNVLSLTERTTGEHSCPASPMIECSGTCGKEVHEDIAVFGGAPEFKTFCPDCAEQDSRAGVESDAWNQPESEPVVTVTNIASQEQPVNVAPGHEVSEAEIPFSSRVFTVKQEMIIVDPDRVAEEFAAALATLPPHKKEELAAEELDTKERDEFEAALSEHRAMSETDVMVNATKAAQDLERQLQAPVVSALILCTQCGDSYTERYYKVHSCFMADNVARSVAKPEGVAESEPHKVYPAGTPDNAFIRDLYVDMHNQLSALKDLSLEESAKWKKALLKFQDETKISDVELYELTKVLTSRMASDSDTPTKKPRAVTKTRESVKAAKAEQAELPSGNPPAIKADTMQRVIEATTVREATHLLMGAGYLTQNEIVAQLEQVKDKSKALSAVRSLKERVEVAMGFFNNTTK